jgi:hypothetical protein
VCVSTYSPGANRDELDSVNIRIVIITSEREERSPSRRKSIALVDNFPDREAGMQQSQHRMSIETYLEWREVTVSGLAVRAF